MSMGLRASAVTIAPPGRPPVGGATWARYLHDLTAPFGVTVEPELAEGGGNITHIDLIDLLVPSLSADRYEPDLVILTHALPGLSPHRAAASHLNHVTGGRALSFAVLGQGLGSPFTALRIALAYTASGRCRTPLIAVLEQTTIPYRDPVVHGGIPLVDSGVLLAFDRDAATWRPRLIAEVPSREKLAVRLAELAADAEHPLLVLGPWAGPDEAAAVPLDVRRVAPGSYATSVWVALAQSDAWSDGYDALLLCDTDPRSGMSHVARFDRAERFADSDGLGHEPRSSTSPAPQSNGGS